MPFSLTKNVKRVIPIPVEVGLQPEPDGRIPVVTHMMAIPDEGYRIDGFLDRIREAGTGKEGDARDEALEEAYFQIWEGVVRGVKEYEDVSVDAPKSELVAYFRGERMPEGAAPEDLALFHQALKAHVREAVANYLSRFPIPQRIR